MSGGREGGKGKGEGRGGREGEMEGWKEGGREEAWLGLPGQQKKRSTAKIYFYFMFLVLQKDQTKN